MKICNVSGIKMILDLAAVLGLLASMGFRVTGSTLHEWLGTGTVILFVAHNILNYRWYGMLFRGRYGVFRVINTAVNLLLVSPILLLLVTGMMTSRILFPYMPGPDGMFIRQMHVLAAYWSLVLVSVHLGLHGKLVRETVWKIVACFPWSRFWMAVLRVFVLLLACYGVKASFEQNVGAKLIMYYSFDFWNPNSSAVMYFLAYLAIMAVWAVSVYYFQKLVRFWMSS
ncbi:MAG: DUF4405 domain-containing protein [Planctomycetia bacterium]|nr:DUF4405 domain-containing protein [Planctomycetia bacterium]